MAVDVDVTVVLGRYVLSLSVCVSICVKNCNDTDFTLYYFTLDNSNVLKILLV